MESKKTIVLVLRSGGDFSMRDVELLVKHIIGKWKALTLPRIILLWDKASERYDLGNIEIIPLKSEIFFRAIVSTTFFYLLSYFLSQYVNLPSYWRFMAILFLSSNDIAIITDFEVSGIIDHPGS
jgi:hypothetical protein